jgi:hypothetical protein
MLQHKAVELTVLDQNARYQCAVSHLLPPTNTCAASYEYLRYLLRAPMLPPTSTSYRPRPPRLRGLLKEAPEIFTTPESLSGCHSLPQYDNQVRQWSKRLAVAEFVHFTYRGITSCRKRCAKDRGHSNYTFGNRFEVAMESCARTTGSSN